MIESYHAGAMASADSPAGVRQSGRDPAEMELAGACAKIWETLTTILPPVIASPEICVLLELRMTELSATSFIFKQLTGCQLN